MAHLHKPFRLLLGAWAVGMATPRAAARRGACREARPRRRAQHRRCVVHCRGLRVPAHKNHASAMMCNVKTAQTQPSSDFWVKFYVLQRRALMVPIAEAQGFETRAGVDVCY